MATKNELKETVQEALKEEFGFAPAKKDITLLEASDDRKYILFSIRQRVYRFLSHETGFGIWCGEGTITRM